MELRARWHAASGKTVAVRKGVRSCAGEEFADDRRAHRRSIAR